jgi:CheY-like chemotaxis protein
MGVSDTRPVVVLADDDDAIMSNLAPFLERAGFTVHVAADGDATLELVERLDPDGCVLDVLMPGWSASGSRYPIALGLSAPALVSMSQGCDTGGIPLARRRSRVSH